MIAGAPTVAVAAPCDPCPPDCPMMADLADQAQAGDPSPDGSEQETGNPCKQTIICQASFVAPLPSMAEEAVARVPVKAAHGAFEPLAARSRPPDRELRPPISL